MNNITIFWDFTGIFDNTSTGCDKINVEVILNLFDATLKTNVFEAQNV